jgi:hypothetical protein
MSAEEARPKAMSDLETFPTPEAPKQCLVYVERDETGQPFTKRTSSSGWLMACGRCGWEWVVVK